MRKIIKLQSTIVGRFHREISRKMTPSSQAVQNALGLSIDKAKRLLAQSRNNKTQDKQLKLYSGHAPEVGRISKGKSRNLYEFGAKVSIATTLKGTLIVVARAFPGNPYDDHTLNEQLEKAAISMQASGMKPETANVDLGYRGVYRDNLGIDIKYRGILKRLTDEEMQSVERRPAIEPIIGHLKADHRMNWCHLKGSKGDSLHAVLCAAGFNIRWLLRMIVKKGMGLFLRLLQTRGLGHIGHQLKEIFIDKSSKSCAMHLELAKK